MGVRPMHDLGKEHGGIMRMFKVMETVANKLRKSEAVETEHLNKIVEFLANFADRCHHGKEEDILFPELTKDTTKTKLINNLLEEHKIGRGFIKKIVNFLKKYKPGNPEAFNIATNMEGYIRLLTEHIKKENPIFHEADEKLPEKIQNDMMEKFEALEKDVIGEGKHEEYHKLLDMLEQIYLPKANF